MKRSRKQAFDKLVLETIQKVISERDITDFDGKGQGFVDMIKKYHKAVQQGDVEGMTDLMVSSQNDPAFLEFLTSGKYADQSGEDDDKVPAEIKPLKANALRGSQMEIDWDKSIAFPLAGKNGWNWSVKACSKGGPVTPGGNPITAGKTTVLDGHHRWSGCYSINPQCTVNCLDFTFPPQLSKQQQLVALHSAISAASENPAGFKGSPAGEFNIGKMTDATPAFDARIGTAATDRNIKGKILAGDEWIEAARTNPLNEQEAAVMGFGTRTEPEKSGDPVQVSGAKDDHDTRLAQALSEAQITGGGWKECPYRSVMFNQIISNMSGLPGIISQGDPARLVMPQSDSEHMFGAGGGDAGAQKTKEKLASGEIHVNDDFDPSAITAGHQLTGETLKERWNKLAGLLKD